MKKTIFLGIAVLLALAVFSCGDPSLPKDEDNAGGITLFGPELTTGRALIGATSEAGTNYYEATFQKVSDSKIIRTKWGYARKGRIQLEPGTYNVILMAGRSTDTTLLGVGRASTIVDVDNVQNPPVTTINPVPAGIQVTIETTTTDLYFTVYALLNDINGRGTPGDSTPTNGVSESTFYTALNTTVTSKYPLPTTKDELGNTVPVFMITQDDETTATWKFGLGALPGNAGDQISLFGPSIFVAGTPTLYETGFSYTDTYDVPQQLVDKKITAPANAAAITGTVTMTLTAPDDDGMVQLALEIPVVAIANSDEATLWYIRGGLNNGAIDAGIGPTYFAKPGKIGGAVVIGFGNLANFPVINLIPHPYIP